MAVNNCNRTLRDGSLTINDGSETPKSMTLSLDQGDLSWTETKTVVKTLNRGKIAGGCIRPGNEENVTLSFTTAWTQLLGYTEDAQDPSFLYEMLNNIGDTYTSTFANDCLYTLEFVFTVSPCGGVGAEVITFAYVYHTSLTMAEGDDSNTISFDGEDWELRPTVERVGSGSSSSSSAE